MSDKEKDNGQEYETEDIVNIRVIRHGHAVEYQRKTEELQQVIEYVNRLKKENPSWVEILKQHGIDVSTPEAERSLEALIEAVEKVVDDTTITPLEKDMQDYRANMTKPTGEWITEPEEVLQASYLQYIEGHVMQYKESGRLFNNKEHELLTLLRHYYQIAVVEMVESKDKPAFYEDRAVPFQEKAITWWEMKHGKGLDSLKSIAERPTKKKHYTVEQHKDNYPEGTVTLYAPTETGIERRCIVAHSKDNIKVSDVLNSAEVQRTGEKDLNVPKDFDLVKGYKLTTTHELLGASILLKLLTSDNKRFSQEGDRKARGLFTYPTTAITNNIFTAGSKANPGRLSIETAIRKGELTNDIDNVALQDLARILDNGQGYKLYPGNKKATLIVPNISPEARGIAGELLLRLFNNAISDEGKLSVNLSEYMEANGLTHRQSASKTFQEIITYLRDILCVLEIGENRYRITHLVTFDTKYKNGETTIEAIALSEDFKPEIRKYAPTYLAISDRILTNIDKRYYVYATGFLEVIMRHKTANQGKANEDIISVDNFIKHTPDFAEYIDRKRKIRKLRLVMDNFDKHIDALTQEAGFVWHYSNGAKDSSKMRYEEWEKQKVIIKYNEKLEEENKEARQSRIDYQTKKAKEQEEEAILTKAKVIKSKRRVKNKTKKKPE